MTKPIVLVTSDVKFFENYYWHAAPETYLRALVKGADVNPLIMPSLPTDQAELDGILDRVDGVLATGSKSNVNPELYGEEPTEENGPYDTARDATSMPMLKRAIERGIPVFAICRGMQELNVCYGGTLLTEIQEMDGVDDHRAPDADHQDERFRMAHPINIEPGSQLADAIGDTTAEVNSLHRQAVGKLGDGLKVEARAKDGTVEAISVEGAKGFMVATQWHPEYWAETDIPSRHLFKAFGDATRDYAANRGK